MKQITWMLTTCLLLGCTPTTPPPPSPTPYPLPTVAPTNTPYVLPAAIPAGGMIQLSLEAAGTPEANPTLTIAGVIVDETTLEPIIGDVYIVDTEEERAPLPDELEIKGTTNFEIILLSQLDGWLVVKAPGYQDWRFRLFYRFKTSRRLDGPVPMKRLLDAPTT